MTCKICDGGVIGHPGLCKPVEEIMNCKYCGDGKAGHVGPCEPEDPKPTVRWGVTFLDKTIGARRRTYPIGGGKSFESFDCRQKALSRAGDFGDKLAPSIVKLTRKAKPKVVAHVVKMWTKGTSVRWLLEEAVREAVGAVASIERVMRLTLEELADDE